MTGARPSWQPHWRRLQDSHDGYWYRSSDGRWEIRRHIEIIWRRTPTGNDNADEPTTDWARLEDAKHLDTDVAQQYPKPRTPRRRRATRVTRPPRRTLNTKATHVCRRCRQPIYQNSAKTWCHLHGDNWIKPHQAEPAMTLHDPNRSRSTSPDAPATTTTQLHRTERD